MENKTALITRMKRAALVYKLSSSVLRENVLLRESCVMETKIVHMEVMKTNIVVSDQTLVLAAPYILIQLVKKHCISHKTLLRWELRKKNPLQP